MKWLSGRNKVLLAIALVMVIVGVYFSGRAFMNGPKELVPGDEIDFVGTGNTLVAEVDVKKYIIRSYPVVWGRDCYVTADGSALICGETKILEFGSEGKVVLTYEAILYRSDPNPEKYGDKIVVGYSPRQPFTVRPGDVLVTKDHGEFTITENGAISGPDGCVYGWLQVRPLTPVLICGNHVIFWIKEDRILVSEYEVFLEMDLDVLP